VSIDDGTGIAALNPADASADTMTEIERTEKRITVRLYCDLRDKVDVDLTRG
jgi:hypothetical protein